MSIYVEKQITRGFVLHKVILILCFLCYYIALILLLFHSLSYTTDSYRLAWQLPGAITSLLQNDGKGK